MTAYDHFRRDFLASLERMRDEAAVQLELFKPGGTCKTHRGGIDTTRDTYSSIERQISDFDDLIARVRGDQSNA